MGLAVKVSGTAKGFKPCSRLFKAAMHRFAVFRQVSSRRVPVTTTLGQSSSLGSGRRFLSRSFEGPGLSEDQLRQYTATFKLDEARCSSSVAQKLSAAEVPGPEAVASTSDICNCGASSFIG